MNLIYTSYNEFVKDFPSIDNSYKEYITNEIRYSFTNKTKREKERLRRLPKTAKMYWIVKSYFTCLPHGYAIVKIVAMQDGTWKVYVNDGDDAYMEKYVDSEDNALIAVTELLELVPFHFSELKDFGYIVG